MTDGGKEPYPDDIDQTTCGWPDGDEEVEYDEGGLEEAKEPYPDDVDK